MKILIQRVLTASVEIEGKVAGSIGPGLLVFLGITPSDTTAQSKWLSNKLVNLRIFEDALGKLNESLLDQKSKEVLIVSQFTLYGDCNEGRRPSFTQAAHPDHAKPLYEHFIQEVKKLGAAVQTGVFGATMQVALINDGPVTLILERDEMPGSKSL